MKIINLVVAFSNLYGLFLLRNFDIKSLFHLCTISSSFLMHISETKHNLNGIYPFNKYSLIFLNLDRFFAYSEILFVLFNLYFDPDLIQKIIIKTFIGLLCLFLSENIEIIVPNSSKKIKKYFFAVLHGCWHIFAYNILLNF